MNEKTDVTYTVSMKWSGFLLLTTTAALVVLAAAPLYGIYAALTSADYVMLAASVLMLVICAGVVVAAEGYAPQYLELNSRDIVIVRRFSDVVIPRSRIIEIVPLRRGSLRWAFRTGGNGGLFGFYGAFYSRRIGNFMMYATSHNNLYLVRTIERNYVLSCDDAEHLFN